MSTTAVNPIRTGFHTVTPYLTVQNAAGLIDFVQQAFGAEQLMRGTGSAGGIHCEVRIGDSILMIGGGGEWRGTPLPAAIHLYVPDADKLYQRAVEAGARTVRPPTDQPYGDREADIADQFGNNWYIATHTATPGRFIPEGLHTATLALHPKGAPKLIDFLKDAFGAKEAERHETPNGTVVHAKVEIGNSIVEIGEAHAEFETAGSAIYLYVDDADVFYRQALKAGATSLWPPTDQPYGDRMGGVTDPFGNQWYISTHIAEAPGEQT